MAYDLPQVVIPGAEANGDQSSNQFKCMKKNATDNQYILCTADGEVFDGVLYNDPTATGNAIQIVANGYVRVEAGETLTAGDHWGTDASGLAKKIEATNTGADVGDYVAGRVQVGVATGELATVSIGIHTFKVESA